VTANMAIRAIPASKRDLCNCLSFA
jgi:hypothetical protein